MNWETKIAWVVSRVFDPVVEIPILLAGTVYYALSNGLRWRFFSLLLVVDAILPAMFMLYQLKTGKVKDWDMTKRKERFELYFFTIFAHLFGVVAAYAVGKQALFEILLIMWSLAVVFALITLFWKISVHAGTNAVLVAFFNHFYGWDKYWWLVGILALVLWSRVVIKKHSWSQVLIGAGVALGWVSLGLQMI